jgi:hypothetical protein
VRGAGFLWLQEEVQLRNATSVAKMSKKTNVRQLTDVRRNAFKTSDHSPFVSSVYYKNLGGKAPVAKSEEEIHARSRIGRHCYHLPRLYGGPLQFRPHRQWLRCQGAKRCNSTVQATPWTPQNRHLRREFVLGTIPGGMHIRPTLPVRAQDVTYERLLHAQENSADWLTYYGSYNGSHFSTLKQIDTSSAAPCRQVGLSDRTRREFRGYAVGD